MKIASLLLLAIGLSSCVAKPYMVGSVNEQIKPRCLFKYSSGSMSTTSKSSGSSTGGFINPVQNSSMNPVH